MGPQGGITPQQSPTLPTACQDVVQKSFYFPTTEKRASKGCCIRPEGLCLGNWLHIQTSLSELDLHNLSMWEVSCPLNMQGSVTTEHGAFALSSISCITLQQSKHSAMVKRDLGAEMSAADSAPCKWLNLCALASSS